MNCLKKLPESKIKPAIAGLRSQRGVTLVELLLAVTISGMIMILMGNIFHAGISVWRTLNENYDFISNAARAMELISAEVRQAEVIEIVQTHQLQLINKNKKIRFRIQTSDEGLNIVREVWNSNSDWQQQPKFPLVRFLNHPSRKQVKVQFEKINDLLIKIKISNTNHVFQPLVMRRKE